MKEINYSLLIFFALGFLSQACADDFLPLEDQHTINEALAWCAKNDGPCENYCTHLKSSISMALQVADHLIDDEAKETSPKQP